MMRKQSYKDKQKGAGNSADEKSWSEKATGSVSGLFSRAKASAQGYETMDASLQQSRSRVSAAPLVSQSTRLNSEGVARTTVYGTFRL